MDTSHAEAAQEVAQAAMGSGPTTLELVGTILFGLAVLHTFVATKFEKLAHKYPEGSIKENKAFGILCGFQELQNMASFCSRNTQKKNPTS